MTHATAEQIHDHVCGFRRLDHVESCVDCGRAAGVVADELDALRDVLNAELPKPAAARPRPRIGFPALVAAALLLGTLSWLLFQPHAADRTPAEPFPSQENEIRRLIGELKSPSPPRQELARLALRMYGGVALEQLRRAQVDPLFIDEILGVTEVDRALIRKMKSTRITLNLERRLYSEAVYELEKTVGAMEWDFRGVEFDTAYITFRIEDGTVYDAVEKLSATLRMPFQVRQGKVRFGTPEEIPARIPLRLRPRDADPAPHIRALSNDLSSRRDKASAALRDLGFATEPELWEALGAESQETRMRAAELLKRLYTLSEVTDPTPPGRPPGHRITVYAENKPLNDLLAEILAQGDREYSLIWGARIPVPEQLQSFAVQDIVLDGALRLLLGQHQLETISLEGSTLVTGVWGAGDAWRAAWTPPRHVLWMRASDAGAIQPLIDDLASEDAARRQKADREFRKLPPEAALDGLACAAGYLDGKALARCQRLRREIGEKATTWIQDIPSGAELQTLAPAQKGRLDGAVAPSDATQTLDQILGKAGFRADYRVPVEGAMKIHGKGPKLSTLLKLVLRTRGLDFRLDGDSVVVDSMANVRAAVEK